MGMGQVGGAGAELDPVGRVDQRRQEQHRAGDVLGGVGQVLADERIVIAEPVAQHDRLAILLERLGVVGVQRMHGHREIAETHAGILLCFSAA